MHYFETDASSEKDNNKIYWVTYSPMSSGRKKIKYMVDAFNLKSVKFMGQDVYVPYPTDKYLEQHYGKDWYIPKKWQDYKYYKSPVSIVQS